MTPVDSNDAYQNYNTAQALFASSDQDAFVADAVTKLEGYGTTTDASEYTKAVKAVYINYNGDFYKNTTTGETDSFTKSVLNTINGEDDGVKTRKSYLVTFNYVVNGIAQNQYTNVQHYYGDIVDMNYSGDATVVGWSVEHNGIKTSINNQTNDFSLKVQSNTTVNVYVTTADNTKCEVQVLDYFGRAQVVYVDAGTVATVNGEEISFSDGTAPVSNQNCNYYSFTGLTVKGEAVTGDYTINENTVFVAKGTIDDSTMAYSVIGGTFAGGSDSTAYKVDDLVTITPTIENCAGIALDNGDGSYTMLAYGNSSFTFFAFPVSNAFNDGVKLVCVASDDVKLSDDQKNLIPESFGIGLRNTDAGKVSMYCMMTTGYNTATVNIVERGIIMTKNTGMDENLFVKGADGVTTFRSSSDINSSQYMITVKTSADVLARSYVSYTVNTTVNGLDVNVPYITYGDIVAM